MSGMVERAVAMARRFKDEERALTMVYWQIKELRWHGVDMTAEARAILEKVKTEKPDQWVIKPKL